jgi:hypothetical protein
VCKAGNPPFPANAPVHVNGDHRQQNPDVIHLFFWKDPRIKQFFWSVSQVLYCGNVRTSVTTIFIAENVFLDVFKRISPCQTLAFCFK